MLKLKTVLIALLLSMGFGAMSLGILIYGGATQSTAMLVIAFFFSAWFYQHLITWLKIDAVYRLIKGGKQ